MQKGEKPKIIIKHLKKAAPIYDKLERKAFMCSLEQSRHSGFL